MRGAGEDFCFHAFYVSLEQIAPGELETVDGHHWDLFPLGPVPEAETSEILRAGWVEQGHRDDADA